MSSSTDYLVIGSGIAALRAALELGESADVTVLTKSASAEGNTAYAQGGIAAAVGPNDDPGRHARDTLAAGDGICDEEAVRVLVESGPHDVRQLMDWGAHFDRAPDGSLSLAQEAAHSVRRVLHARDAPGREIARVLWNRASALPRLRVIEHARAIGFIVERGVCRGARYLDPQETQQAATAQITLLATGGAGLVYSETTNPDVASGDGIAMAYLAGARVADLEFVQFHPTALAVEGQPRFLLSEALRGEGACLLNAKGEAFMSRYDPAGDLAPRDRVSRAIVREMERTGQPVFLSMRHLDAAAVHARFPRIAEACRQAGLDLARDQVPVSPAAHYVMGGVETDLDARTSLPGLFAAGEVACTGVHGANRLASNSLLEGLVFGRRAGKGMLQERQAPRPWQVDFHSRLAAPLATSEGQTPVPRELLQMDVRDLMWRAVGVQRDGPTLSAAVAALEAWWLSLASGEPPKTAGPKTAADAQRISLVTVARLMARAALRREESRGGHFRADYPARDDRRWGHRVAEIGASADE